MASNRRERGLRRRRDAGQDASGTHRNIARSVPPPPEMLSGMRTTVESPWRFVLETLASFTKSGNTDPPPAVKMLDTILMETTGGGQPEEFFYTAADGSVQCKAERFLSLKSIEKTMLSRAHGICSLRKQLLPGEHDPTQDVVAMAKTRNGTYVSITSKALRAAVKSGAMSSEFDFLVPFVRAKDFSITGEFANYEHEYVLGDTGGGLPTNKAYRRGVKSEALGNSNCEKMSHGRTYDLVLNRNARLNAEINSTARAILLAVERVKHCRVLRLATEFVVDDEDNLWLLGVTFCRIASRPSLDSFDRTMSSAESYAAVDTPGVSTVTTDSKGAGEGNVKILATEERSRNRQAEKDARVLDDAEFSLLLQKVGYRSPMQQFGKNGYGRRYRQRRTSAQNKNEQFPKVTQSDSLREDCSSSSSPPPSRLVISEALRDGTSRTVTDENQKSFSWTGLDDKGAAAETPAASGSRGVGESEEDAIYNEAQFPPPRQSVMRECFDNCGESLDQMATNRIYGSTQLEGCRGDFCEFDVGKRVREEQERKVFIDKTARAAGAMDGLAENLSPVRLKILSLDSDVVGGEATSGGRRSGRGPKITRHTDTSCEQYYVPYKAVVQARQEMVLVEAFLRRYARGEKGEYIYAGDAGREERYSVGVRFPGVYYRPVKVCSNCQMVYTLIDRARASSLRRMPGNGEEIVRDKRQNRHRSHAKSCRTDSVGSLERTGMECSEPESLKGGNYSCGVSPAVQHRVENIPDVARAEVLPHAHPEVGDGFEHSPQVLSLAEARKAMDAVSQADISELRSFSHPPTAVTYVAYAALGLLDGRRNSESVGFSSWVNIRAVLGRTDFFSRLRTIDPRAVKCHQLQALEPALASTGFRPSAVRPFSNAAANLSLWVLGVVQANQWMTGNGHPRTNIVPPAADAVGWGKGGRSLDAARISTFLNMAWFREQPSCPQPFGHAGQATPRRPRRCSSFSRRSGGRQRGRLENSSRNAEVSSGGSIESNRTTSLGRTSIAHAAATNATVAGMKTPNFRIGSPLAGDPATSTTLDTGAVDFECSPDTRRSGGARDRHVCTGTRSPGRGKVFAQALASDRLMHPEGQHSIPRGKVAQNNEFSCSDGKTRMPYRVCGESGVGCISSCNFVVVHDFFDNVDKTEVLFREVTRQHRGCRVLVFSYPGQSGTVFEVPPSMATGVSAGPVTNGNGRIVTPQPDGLDAWGASERKEVVANNAFIAPRLHELLQHVHSVGDMRLTDPFHLLGIGNGTAIAIAFALRYGDHPLYSSSLRSVVSINGFCSVDPQLAAVLHSSINAFATLPPSRSDLPISFMSRYAFSDGYLRKVGRDLALGIYTAISNPITLEGRQLICKSALLHEDLSAEVGFLGVPLVLLQSTEDVFVNPANVDPFLRGRSFVHHFWSHEFHNPPAGTEGRSGGGGEDVGEHRAQSVYGRKGLTDLLRALSKPGGTFVAWVRAGHEVRQESKRAVMDMLDTLANPTPSYNGVAVAEVIGEGAIEGERRVTLGLYPSSGFVARINGKQRGGRAGAKQARYSPEEMSIPSSFSGDGALPQRGDSGDAATIFLGSSKRRREMPEKNNPARPTPSTTNTPMASPFPRNIHIPTLPAAARRNTNHAPFTSPFKRTRTAIDAARYHNTDSQQTATIEAFPVADDRCGEKDGEGIGRDRDINRRWGPAGTQATSEFVTTRSQREHIGGIPRGIFNVPATVWVEEPDAVEVTSVTSHGIHGEEHESVDGDRIFMSHLSAMASPRDTVPINTNSSFHCNEAKVGSDSDTCPRELVSGRRPAGSDAHTADGTSAKTSWNPARSPPSLDLLASDIRQRNTRRWVPNTGGGSRQVCGTVDGTEADNAGASTAVTTSYTAAVDPLNELLVAEAHLEDRLCAARQRAAALRQREEAALDRRFAGVQGEQEKRSKTYMAEDANMIVEFEKQLAAARLARAPTDLQRAVDGANIDDEIEREGLISPRTSAFQFAARSDLVVHCEDKGPGSAFSMPSRAMPPIDYSPLEEVPEELRWAGDAYSLMADAQRDHDEMTRLRREEGKLGAGNLTEFQQEQAMAAAEAAIKRAASRKAYEARSQSDLVRAQLEAASRVQPLVRGIFGRRRAMLLRHEKDERNRQAAAAKVIQTSARGHLGKGRARRAREATMAELVLEGSALRLQSVGRGMLGRRRAAVRRRELAALTIERCFRGHLGRRYAVRQQAMLEKLKARHLCAVKIQTRWRCKHAVEEYASRRVFSLAVVEIQRVYRGVIGRRKAKRTMDWAKTGPGPERLKLGMRMIEDTKVAFERQRLEIAALHQAEEKAVERTSLIRRELGSSEKELSTLERELKEIEHVEDQLKNLTHERSLLQHGLLKSGEFLKDFDIPTSVKSATNASAGKVADGVSGGGRGSKEEDETKRMLSIVDKHAGFALEMQIQIKRAEREKRRQQIEADFKGVCGEVDRKRRELERVGDAIQQIEATRDRKVSEFRRMQTNLMQLLYEQKTELDNIKEKGAQLEVAQATSAAAATATAERAKEHEESSSAMFSQTEELMKFQFMSMSLSYFSSLNMLKTMRDINADTTTAAVTSSADAAAAAAASAAAASLPAIKAGKVIQSATDIHGAGIELKKKKVNERLEAERGVEEAKAHPFPREVRFWTVKDVGYFLHSLGLGQYRRAFEEAAVDGEFLLALDASDCADVLGVSHALHSKKLFLAINKLRPLSADEMRKKVVVEREENADNTRGNDRPDVQTVMSQVRNGRMKRVEESLEMGFSVDTKDEHGNTPLIVACQNVNLQMSEMLLRRGAKINHRNGGGNTALHYAMAYEPNGLLGEMLISNGADDSIENKDSLSCYDGLGGFT